MADFITCDTSQLSDEQLFAALITKNSAGDWALRTTFVNACAEDAIDCNNSQIDFKTISRKVIGIDPVCGKPAIRLANTKAYLLQSVVNYANDAAAATGGVPVGELYYNTTTSKLHVRMT